MKIITTTLFLLWASIAIAQENAPAKNTAQATIMVVPFTKANDDIRRTLDADPNRRIAITKIKEAFDNRGFSTIDFVAKLKEAETRQVFTMDNQTENKPQIIESGGANIWGGAGAVTQRRKTGKGGGATLPPNDPSTATSLSNKVGFSGKFYTEDFGKLTAKAVESVVEDFLNVMQAKFTEMLENGRFVAVEFSFSADSDLRMSTEIAAEGLPLSDLLEVWMDENAFKGSYHIQGTSDVKVIFDQVRIPVKDASGAAYTTNKFALEIFKYCRKISKPGDVKVGVKKEVKGNTIFITLT